MQRDQELRPGSQRSLWNDETQHTLSLGCIQCPDRAVCGGLSVARAAWNCMDYCACTQPSECDTVCRRKVVDFIQRVKEVNGFRLDNVPRTARLVVSELPSFIPFLYGGSSRVIALRGDAVALSLYELFDLSTWEPKYPTRAELANAFCFSDKARVALSGVEIDAPLESWWAMPKSSRLPVLQYLRELGVDVVTVPNFSVFSGLPRWDNLHAMKRIAVAWSEMQSEGVAAALHLNARTETDWRRWAEFIRARDEVTHVSFEFGTGAGHPRRSAWYAERLCELAHFVERPLSLLLRGGMRFLSQLAESFGSVSLIDTAAYVRTVKRRRAVIDVGGRLRWHKAPTDKGEPLDALFDANIQTVRSKVEELLLGSRHRT